MTSTKIVRPQSKGMVTIPASFRSKLGIDENSLLEARLTKNGVEFIRINILKTKKAPELYNDAQVKKWLKDDAIDAKTALKLSKLLK